MGSLRPPRLSADEFTDPVTTSTLGGRSTSGTPRVMVSVEWDFGDEERALRTLDDVVKRVRARINLAVRANG